MAGSAGPAKQVCEGSFEAGRAKTEDREAGFQDFCSSDFQWFRVRDELKEDKSLGLKAPMVFIEF